MIWEIIWNNEGIDTCSKRFWIKNSALKFAQSIKDDYFVVILKNNITGSLLFLKGL